MTPRIAEILAKLHQSEAREVLLSLGAVSALKSFDRDCQQRYAAELLAQHRTRAFTRDRLIQRYQISMSSAYRLIDNVIQNRFRTGHPLTNTAGTPKAHNQ